MTVAARLTILPVTGDLRDAPLFRIRVAPDASNGLRRPSDVMVDKPQSVPRDEVGTPIGRLADDALLRVDRALALFPGFA
jgi:mRNA interferase MazF